MNTCEGLPPLEEHRQRQEPESSTNVITAAMERTTTRFPRALRALCKPLQLLFPKSPTAQRPHASHSIRLQPLPIPIQSPSMAGVSGPTFIYPYGPMAHGLIRWTFRFFSSNASFPLVVVHLQALKKIALSQVPFFSMHCCWLPHTLIMVSSLWFESSLFYHGRLSKQESFTFNQWL